MAGFLIVITFLVGAADVKSYQLRCPDMACVHRIEEQAGQSLQLRTLRVFPADARFLPTSGLPVFPPIIERWYQ